MWKRDPSQLFSTIVVILYHLSIPFTRWLHSLITADCKCSLKLLCQWIHHKHIAFRVAGTHRRRGKTLEECSCSVIIYFLSWYIGTRACYLLSLSLSLSLCIYKYIYMYRERGRERGETEREKTFCIGKCAAYIYATNLISAALGLFGTSSQISGEFSLLLIYDICHWWVIIFAYIC